MAAPGSRSPTGAPGQAFAAEGLPVGVHFSAAQGQERMLLKLAYELTAARPWAGRAPRFVIP